MLVASQIATKWALSAFLNAYAYLSSTMWYQSTTDSFHQTRGGPVDSDHPLVSCVQHGAYAAHAITIGRFSKPCVWICCVNCSSSLRSSTSTDEENIVFNYCGDNKLTPSEVHRDHLYFVPHIRCNAADASETPCNTSLFLPSRIYSFMLCIK